MSTHLPLRSTHRLSAPSTPSKAHKTAAAHHHYGFTPLNELDTSSPLHSPMKSRKQYAALHPAGVVTGGLLGSPTRHRHSGTDLLSRLAAKYAPELLEQTNGPTVGPPPPPPPAQHATTTDASTAAAAAAASDHTRHASPARPSRTKLFDSDTGRGGGGGGGSGGSGRGAGSGSSNASARLSFLKSPAKPAALSYGVVVKATVPAAAAAAAAPAQSPTIPRHSQRAAAANSTPQPAAMTPGAAAAFAASDAMRTPVDASGSAASPSASASPAPLSPQDLLKHSLQSPMPPTVVAVTRRLCQ